MKKGILIFIVAVLIVVIFYAYMKNKSDENSNIVEPPVAYSTASYVVFSKDFKSQFLTEYDRRYTPTREEVEKGLTIINRFLEKQTTIRGLSEYKTQIIGFINDKGKKTVYANYFCGTDFTDWLSKYVYVLDGGNCFFNVKANLQTEEVFDLNVNGDA